MSGKSKWLISLPGARAIFSLVAAACLASICAYACSWEYSIWAIRTPNADPLFRFEKNGKVGYIDKHGHIVVQPTLPGNGNFGGEFHEGLLGIREVKGYRFIDLFGATVFLADVSLVLQFSEGLAPAVIDGDSAGWGYIGQTGKFVIPPRCRAVDSFSEGLARISVKSEFNSPGYIDKAGYPVIPPNLSYGRRFQEGLAAVIPDGPCSISNSGSCMRPEFRPSQPNAQYDCRYTFIDRTGQLAFEGRFDDAEGCSEGLAPVRVGKAWGFVDKHGHLAIAPTFEMAMPFSEGLAAVFKNRVWGFIDHQGEITIPLQFASARSFCDGRAVVSQLDKHRLRTSRFIGKSGRPAFPGVYAEAESFRHGLAPVIDVAAPPGHRAWIDVSGNTVFAFTSSARSNF